MNRIFYRSLLITALLFLAGFSLRAQLQVTEVSSAQLLAQKLVGDGVIISNATITNSPSIVPTGFFVNAGGTNINIDSGIVITSGRAKTDRSAPNLFGVDGNGTNPAGTQRADNNLGLPGDATLANALGIPVTDLNDAIALEFDFVPLGDSIRFRYIMSSEEYTPGTVCVFNDAFGFFISGPGITGSQNIALIPGTSTPVTISNVNNITTAGCVSHPEFYIDNITNVFFTHEGHTKVFVAEARVQPCETYHLKIVIADRGDHLWDSGVFLEAKSLTSNAIGMNNLTQTDPSGNSYLVEGCVTGSFEITRPRKDPTPLSVTLSYAGTATNGVDYLAMPTVVTIPANDSIISVNVIPIIDALPEGIEFIKIYALAGCTAGTPTDSTIIQIRDYDTLTLSPGSGAICRNGSQQLQASGSYATYLWDADPTLNNINIQNPIATPVNAISTYYCTATEGTCNARDSIRLEWKQLEFTSKLDVNCRNGSTGQISVSGGGEWQQPVEFSLDGINWQPDSVFNNLPVGNYSVKIRDASCIDSIPVSIIQAFPDLNITVLATTAATCSGNPDGTATLSATGGNNSYTYSSDGLNFQTSPIFNLAGGNYVFTVKDGNGCTNTANALIPLINTVTVDAGIDTSICSGRSYLIPASSNAGTFSWTPASSLDNASILQPTASPAVDTWYYLTATEGICSRVDSILIRIYPSPVADAGQDISVCYGKTIQLNGSGGIAYQWSPTTNFTAPSNIANPSLKAKQPETYFLTVWDSRGCESLVPDEIVLNVTPAVKIFAGRDTVAAINQPIQLSVRETGTAGVTSYSWSPGLYLDNPNSSTPIAILTQDQRYIVTGTTADGCEGMDDVLVKVYKGPEIYVPSGFTPDNDGRNDLLRAIPVGIREFQFFNVYNRWGQLIFSTRDPKIGWDGRINGIEQPTGSYVWIAQAIDYNGKLISRKGMVTVIR